MKLSIFQSLLLSYLNIPYIYGGKNVLQGEDCSGLVCEILKAIGFIATNEEYGSQELFNKFKPVALDTSSQAGSLVFYGKSESQIDHVAIFIDDVYILEAGHGTAANVTKEISTRTGSYSRLRPYKYRSDLVGILNLNLGLTP